MTCACRPSPVGTAVSTQKRSISSQALNQRHVFSIFTKAKLRSEYDFSEFGGKCGVDPKPPFAGGARWRRWFRAPRLDERRISFSLTMTFRPSLPSLCECALVVAGATRERCVAGASSIIRVRRSLSATRYGEDSTVWDETPAGNAALKTECRTFASVRNHVIKQIGLSVQEGSRRLGLRAKTVFSLKERCLSSVNANSLQTQVTGRASLAYLLPSSLDRSSGRKGIAFTQRAVRYDVESCSQLPRGLEALFLNRKARFFVRSLESADLSKDASSETRGVAEVSAVDLFSFFFESLSSDSRPLEAASSFLTEIEVLGKEASSREVCSAALALALRVSGGPLGEWQLAEDETLLQRLLFGEGESRSLVLQILCAAVSRRARVRLPVSLHSAHEEEDAAHVRCAEFFFLSRWARLCLYSQVLRLVRRKGPFHFADFSPALLSSSGMARLLSVLKRLHVSTLKKSDFSSQPSDLSLRLAEKAFRVVEAVAETVLLEPFLKKPFGRATGLETLEVKIRALQEVQRLCQTSEERLGVSGASEEEEEGQRVCSYKPRPLHALQLWRTLARLENLCVLVVSEGGADKQSKLAASTTGLETQAQEALSSLRALTQQWRPSSKWLEDLSCEQNRSEAFFVSLKALSELPSTHGSATSLQAMLSDPLWLPALDLGLASTTRLAFPLRHLPSLALAKQKPFKETTDAKETLFCFSSATQTSAILAKAVEILADIRRNITSAKKETCLLHASQESQRALECLYAAELKLASARRSLICKEKSLIPPGLLSCAVSSRFRGPPFLSVTLKTLRHPEDAAEESEESRVDRQLSDALHHTVQFSSFFQMHDRTLQRKAQQVVGLITQAASDLEKWKEDDDPKLLEKKHGGPETLVQPREAADTPRNAGTLTSEPAHVSQGPLNESQGAASMWSGAVAMCEEFSGRRRNGTMATRRLLRSKRDGRQSDAAALQVFLPTVNFVWCWTCADAEKIGAEEVPLFSNSQRWSLAHSAARLHALLTARVFHGAETQTSFSA